MALHVHHLFCTSSCCICSCSAAQSCLTLCDPVDCSMSGFPVHHQLLEFIRVHVLWISDAIQPSHPLLPSFPPALNLSQHQGLLQWVDLFYQVAKVLELQLQNQSFQWVFRVDFLLHKSLHGREDPEDFLEAEPFEVDSEGVQEVQLVGGGGWWFWNWVVCLEHLAMGRDQRQAGARKKSPWWDRRVGGGCSQAEKHRDRLAAWRGQSHTVWSSEGLSDGSLDSPGSSA